MSEARIARFATSTDDIDTLPADTIIVSANGVPLIRTADNLCRPGVGYWFDPCPGCDQWLSLDPHHPAAHYGHDQLFMEFGDRELSRAFCSADNQADRAPYDSAYDRPALTGPFLIAYVPSRRPATTGAHP